MRSRHITSLKQKIKAQTGLDFSNKNNADQFAREFERLLAASRKNESELTQELERDPTRLLAFVERLTVGETYFFRHIDQLELLTSWLRSEHTSGRSWRFWSAGCATGEEAYSLAILGTQTLPAAPLTVIGTDINSGYLERARRACYSKNAFRDETPPFVAERCCERLDDRTWKVREDLRRGVRFVQLNLANPPYPPEIGAFDVVFFRNVSLYLSSDVIDRILEGIFDALRPGGVLALSPCEGLLFRRPHQFELLRSKRASLYRKMADGSRTTRPQPTAVDRQSRVAATTTSGHRRTASSASSPVSPARVSGAPLRIAPDRRSARAADPDFCAGLVNQARYVEAIEYVLGFAPNEVDYVLRYHLAVAYGELALLDDAIREHRRVLTERPDFVLSAIATAGIFKQLGDQERSERSLNTARTLLQQMEPEAEVPFSDGILATALLATIEAMIG